MKQCTDCGEIKRLTDFYRRSDRPDGYRSTCRQCHAKAAKAKNATTEEQAKRRERHRKHARYKNYGMTKEQFDALMTEQHGRCAICEVNLDESCHIDHCHKTGKIRGLLCRACNTGLGCFQDDMEVMEIAVRYLRIRS